MTSDIGIQTVLHTSFEQAISRATEALRVEGFGVLTQIDVQTTLKQKINVEFRRYLILGACNPTLAHPALSANPDVGLLLPCKVTVQEMEEGIAVTAVDPMQMLSILADDPIMGEVAKEARHKLERAISSLSTS